MDAKSGQNMLVSLKNVKKVGNNITKGEKKWTGTSQETRAPQMQNHVETEKGPNQSEQLIEGIDVTKEFYCREGLSGRLKPPWRFMYWRYSIFFSFRTP